MARYFYNMTGNASLPLMPRMKEILYISRDIPKQVTVIKFIKKEPLGQLVLMSLGCYPIMAAYGYDYNYGVAARAY